MLLRLCPSLEFDRASRAWLSASQSFIYTGYHWDAHCPVYLALLSVLLLCQSRGTGILGRAGSPSTCHSAILVAPWSHHLWWVAISPGNNEVLPSVQAFRLQWIAIQHLYFTFASATLHFPLQTYQALSGQLSVSLWVSSATSLATLEVPTLAPSLPAHQRPHYLVLKEWFVLQSPGKLFKYRISGPKPRFWLVSCVRYYWSFCIHQISGTESLFQ